MLLTGGGSRRSLAPPGGDLCALAEDLRKRRHLARSFGRGSTGMADPPLSDVLASTSCSSEGGAAPPHPPSPGWTKLVSWADDFAPTHALSSQGVCDGRAPFLAPPSSLFPHTSPPSFPTHRHATGLTCPAPTHMHAATSEATRSAHGLPVLPESERPCGHSAPADTRGAAGRRRGGGVEWSGDSAP
jgi:hypothetical protein